MSIWIRAAILAALLTSFLTLGALRQVTARAGGDELILHAEPVDPRDILLGHYVALSYPASRLDLDQLAGDSVFAARDPVHVVFERNAAGIAEPVGVYRDRPDADIVLSGTARTAARTVTGAGEPGSGSVLIVDLGLPERYYADSPTALALETQLREGGSQVVFSYAPGRKPVIRGLIVDGEPRMDTLF